MRKVEGEKRNYIRSDDLFHGVVGEVGVDYFAVNLLGMFGVDFDKDTVSRVILKKSPETEMQVGDYVFVEVSIFREVEDAAT